MARLLVDADEDMLESTLFAAEHRLALTVSCHCMSTHVASLRSMFRIYRHHNTPCRCSSSFLFDTGTQPCPTLLLDYPVQATFLRNVDTRFLDGSRC